VEPNVGPNVEPNVGPVHDRSERLSYAAPKALPLLKLPSRFVDS
jgi:hypothetical protein